MAVTPANVKVLVETAKSDADLQTFIDTAQLVVDEDLAGKGLSSDRLEKIVLYLSAHFLVLADEMGGIRRSKQGEADDSYRVPDLKETAFNATRFGQMAIALDNSGTLAATQANKGLKAEFRVV